MAENLIFEIPFLEKIDRNPQKPPESQSSFPQFLEKLNDFLLDLEFVWLKLSSDWDWDLGPGTWDLGPGTWDLGPGTWDMGPRT